ncbi:MAG: hypothetical protein JWO31_2300 [Phycisphaerales bacterium]|nr:hypothetical protein [Phycisphaerales bacterium]
MMELADSADPLEIRPDRRPTVPEPPPVRLVAVADVVLVTAPGRERELDAFYVGVLRFERADEPPPALRLVEPILGAAVPVVPPARVDRPLPPVPADALQGPVYRAENCRVSFHVREPLIERNSVRAQGVEVPSLASVIEGLNGLEVEYTPQRGLNPGQRSLLVRDPGGNWVEVIESRPV